MDIQWVAEMSLCDKCFDPGRCCKHLQLFSGEGKIITYWADEDVPDQIAQTLGPHPFLFKEWTDKYIDPDSKREYGTPVLVCSALQPNGRCGIYETRPQLCRNFPEGEGPLCVHFKGAEANDLPITD